MALTISLLEPQTPTALRVVTDPALSDAVAFTLTGEGNPIVFNWVRLNDNSLLLLVLGAVPYTTLNVAIADVSGGADDSYEVPADAVPHGAKLLEAITYAFGKQLQHVSGSPVCTLRKDLGIFDTVLHVDSTLGFPSTGWVRLGELVLEYTSRTSQSLTLRTSALRYPMIRRGTLAYLDVTMITPDGAGFGTESL